MKKNNLLLIWSISLIVIAVCTLVITIANIMGASVPDALIRILGILELVSCPVLAFTTVRMYRKGREEKEVEKKEE